MRSVKIVIAVLAAAILLWFTYDQFKKPEPPAPLKPCTKDEVSVMTGSAKFGFLNDPRVVQELDKACLTLKLTKTGSIESDLEKAKAVDAVWPAGVSAADEFAKLGGSKIQVFNTVLAVASWKPLLPVMESQKYVSAQKGYEQLELNAILPDMVAGKKWTDIPSNNSFPINKSILVSMPNPEMSQTTQQMMALLGYVSNGNVLMQDAQAADKLGAELKPLITRQGFQESTLAGPFEDYTGAPGMGKVPLVLVYESQFVEAKKNGLIRDKHVLLYPNPSMLLKHVWVGYSPKGVKLGELLAKNTVIQKVAAEYGYRTNNPAVFEEHMKSIGMAAPELLNQADIPAPAVMDRFISVLLTK